MNVLVVQEEPATRWGLPSHVLDESRELAARGHVLDLVYRKPGDLVSSYSTFCRSARRLPTLHLDRRHPLSSGAGVVRSAKACRQDPHDIVYLHHPIHDVFGSLVSVARPCRTVLHLRYAPPPHFGVSTVLVGPMLARFVAVSDHTKRTWVAAGLDPDRIDVVHSGVDPAVYSPGDRSRAQTLRSTLGVGERDTMVLYAGRIHPTKGPHVVAEAMSRAGREDLKLVVAGAIDPRPTPEAGDAYADVVRRHAPQSARFVGLVVDMAALYRAADLVVVPSVVEDAFARTVIEAMACGVPVLGSRTGGIPEALGDEFSRLLFEPGNVAELTRLLVEVAGWRERDPRLGQACHARVSKGFVLSREVDGIEASLQAATTDRGTSASRVELARWGRSRP